MGTFEQHGEARMTNLVEQLRQLLNGFVERGETPAAAAAIAVDARQIAEVHVGMARSDLPAGPDTLWPLASISKLYTATAVMSLVERGEVTLSAPISTWLPRFTGGGKERVCLWHLLTHTSGILYEAPEMAELLARETPLDTIVDEVYERPLLLRRARGTATAIWASRWRAVSPQRLPERTSPRWCVSVCSNRRG